MSQASTPPTRARGGVGASHAARSGPDNLAPPTGAEKAGAFRRPMDLAETIRWLDAIIMLPPSLGVLSPAAIKFAGFVRSRYNRKEGFAWFSLATAERHLGLRRASLSRAIGELERAGFLLSMRSDRRHSNQYVMRWEAALDVELYWDGDRMQRKAHRVLAKLSDGREVDSEAPF